MKKAVTLLIIMLSTLLFPTEIHDVDNVKNLKVNSAHMLEKQEDVVLVPNSLDVVGSACSEQPPIEESVEQPETIEISIPTNTYSKTYEDGCFITDKTSPAYQMLSQCAIDYRGHYMYDETYYAVAMGNYFDDVGSKYVVTLDGGSQFKIIKCDVKQDIHTINRMIDGAGAIIEFIINGSVASEYYGIGENGYILGGSFNNSEEFHGKIIGIEQIKE